MKYASLKYNISMSENEIEETQSHQKRIKSNIGDNIQSIATEQFLPIVDKRFNRDALNQVHENEKFLLIMNGWYTHMPENWPPSESIIPVFIGFHIAENKRVQELLLNDNSIDYFKKHEPIGCRDKKTAELLSDRGVKTYYSKCLTLTFPKREYEPQNGKVFLVDVEDIPIPKNLEQGSLSLTHIVPRFISDENKILIAKQILDKYKNEACLVITSRIHCAIPCIAFGIPVIFFGDPDDYRVSILKDLGIEIYKKSKFLIIYNFLKRAEKTVISNKFLWTIFHALSELFRYILINRKVNWNPEPVPIENEKAEVIKKTKETLQYIIKKNTKPLFLNLILFLVLVVSLSYIISDLPKFGEAKASVDSYVTNYYIKNTDKEIGIPNVVTSVLASYRGFDTLGEVVVIFIAGISVIGILREEYKE